jgi:hypothetical protein
MDDVHEVPVPLHHAAPVEESTDTHQPKINTVFTNRSEEDVIYPLTLKEIAQAQKDDAVLKKLSKTDKY